MPSQVPSTSQSPVGEVPQVKNEAPAALANMDLLRDWALRNAITSVVLADLSKTLKQIHGCFKDLPSQGRTLLKTDVKTKPTKCDPGECIHVGLKNSSYSSFQFYSIT